MRELTQNDLNFVLNRCPRDVIKILKNNKGTYLAGGFIRATIAGEKVSDIDLFGDTKTGLEVYAKDLALNRKGKVHKSKNAITVLSPPRFPVQFITRWLFDNPEDLVNSFDFTICQAVIWAEVVEEVLQDETNPSDREQNKETKKIYKFYSLCSDSFYSDLAARRLVYTFPIREEEAGGSFMRVVKFIRKGYNIQAPALAGVVSRLIGKIDESKIDKAEQVRDRTDFVFSLEKWRARVITGLLREVDPLTVVDGVDFVDEHEVV